MPLGCSNSPSQHSIRRFASCCETIRPHDRSSWHATQRLPHLPALAVFYTRARRLELIGHFCLIRHLPTTSAPQRCTQLIGEPLLQGAREKQCGMLFGLILIRSWLVNTEQRRNIRRAQLPKAASEPVVAFLQTTPSLREVLYRRRSHRWRFCGRQRAQTVAKQREERNQKTRLVARQASGGRPRGRSPLQPPRLYWLR